MYPTDRNLGIDTGFLFQYNIDKHNVDEDCMDGLNGLSIMLHAPDEIPSVMKSYTNIAIGSIATVLIRPQVTKLSDELHKMMPHMLVF